MTPEYKAEKEAFVSHLRGGGMWEINAVTLAAPVCAALHPLPHAKADERRRPPHFFGPSFKDAKASSRPTVSRLW